MVGNKIQVQGELDCYVLNEQPTTCGKCGARTFFRVNSDGSQNHHCLNTDCSYAFLAFEGED